MPAFTTTDCWVLFSIDFGQRGATLKEIIATSDILNHAIVTKEELEVSLNKLFLNGFIGLTADKFFTTKKAKMFYRKNKRCLEGCIAEWIRISEVLKKLPAKSSEMNIVKITDEDYAKALNEYVMDFDKRLRD